MKLETWAGIQPTHPISKNAYPKGLDGKKTCPFSVHRKFSPQSDG